MRSLLNRARPIGSLVDNLGLFPKYLFSHGLVVLLTALVISVLSFKAAKDEMVVYARSSAQTIMEQTGLLMEKSSSDLQTNLVAQLEQAGIYKQLRESSPLAGPADRLSLERQFAAMMSTNRWMRSVLLRPLSGTEMFLSSDGGRADSVAIRAFKPEKVTELHGRAYWYVDGRGAVFFCKLLYDLKTSANLGMLAIGIEPSFFDSLASIERNRGLGSFFVISTDSSQLIFHTRASGEVLEKVEAWASGREARPQRFSVRATPHLAMSLVDDSQEWEILNVISIDELTSLSARTGAFILETALCILAVALAFAFFLVRSEVGKIKALVAQARLIGGGNFALSAGFHSRDELGELASEISDMAREIGELVDKVAAERSQKTEAELRALDFEYNALQSRINPHFISNTLEMMNSTAKLNGVPQLGEVACLLGDLMRASIRRKENLLPLEDELELCRTYLRIQELLLESRLNLRYELPPELLGCKVPNLILQPIVENAVIHGIEPKLGASTIAISARREGEALVLVVADDGVGIAPDRLPDLLSPNASEPTRKIGLESVDKRIKILFGQDYGLWIESRLGEGTKVSLRMPYRAEVR